MSRKRKKVGVCCICGISGTLSFEHVPPQSAYNKERIVERKVADKIADRDTKGTIVQGGSGAYTLCQECNNNTGSWYGGEYIKWAHISQSAIENLPHGETQVNPKLTDVYPLRFLKQVVTCFFSVAGGQSGASFANNNPELVRFILERDFQTLPNKYRFFMNLCRRSSNTVLRRFPPLAAKISVSYVPGKDIKVTNSCILSEYTHPPFQMVMTENDLFQNGFEISQFKNYEYEDQTDMELPLRVINSSSILPGNLD
jgi:hypothetical protein